MLRVAHQLLSVDLERDIILILRERIGKEGKIIKDGNLSAPPVVSAYRLISCQFIGIGFIVTAVVATSTMGAAGSILFVFPMLLSIPYCSFLYSLFISAITIMSTFIPMLLSSRLSNYDLNVVRFIPDTVIKITSTLEASLEPGIINAAGTKLNELLSTFLPVLLFLNIIAVVTVSITAAIRKNLLEQYHQFQNTRE